MTTIGKLLAFVNLVVGLSLLAWGVSVYANQPGWVDTKTEAGTVEGQATLLKKEIDRLKASIEGASKSYAQAATELATAESVQAYRKERLDARIVEAQKGTFKEQVPLANDPAFVDVNNNEGKPILDPFGEPLRGVEALVKDFNDQVRQAQLHRSGEPPVQQAEWANAAGLLSPQRFPTLGIDDLRTLHGLLSDQIAAVDVAANKQREVLVNLRNEAAYLTDRRIDWSTRLQTLERRQAQLQNRLQELGSTGGQ